MDKKLMFHIAKELYLDETALGHKNIRDKSLLRLLKSPAVMASEISTKIVTRKI